jgi:hypothetical protein
VSHRKVAFLLPIEDQVTTETTAAAQPAQDAQLTPAQLWAQEAERRANGDVDPVTGAIQPIDGSVEALATEPAPKEAVELPEELKAALAQVADFKSLAEKLQHQVDSSNGRLGAIQRELNAAKSAAAVTQATAPNPQTVQRAAKSPEKWEALKKEFPEWGEAVEDLVRANLNDQGTPTDLNPLNTRLNQGFEILEKLKTQIQEGLVYTAHRDWKTVLQTQAFRGWYDAQAPDVQFLVHSERPEDAIACLDMYKAHQLTSRDATRDVSAERQARLDAAAVTQKKGSPPPPKTDADKTPQELWAEEAARGAARRKAGGY